MEQSDTPRTDAAAERGSDLGGANTMWSGIWPLARDLERELAAATRERDEARAEAERLRSALIDLVNQTRRCDPVDELGHRMVMNMAYIEADKLIDGSSEERP